MRIVRKRYLPSEVRKIHNMLKRGKSFEEIGKAVNRTAGALQVFASRMGWSGDKLENKRRPYTEQEDLLISQWRSNGHKNKVIASGLCRTYGALRQRVSAIGA